MLLTNDKFKVGDRVYCILNHSIVGVVKSFNNYHGMWQYKIQVDDRKGFHTWIGISCNNAVFLHWQLKIKTEVKKNGKRKKDRRKTERRG